jgi:hypothetical protein
LGLFRRRQKVDHPEARPGVTSTLKEMNFVNELIAHHEGEKGGT